MAMTDKQYTGAGGNKCPFCGSENISGNAFNAYGGSTTQEVGCDDCGAEWLDQYILTGYTFTEIPEPGNDVVEVEPEKEIKEEPKLAFFAVTGRIPGDDEDTLHVFEAATRDEAVEAFEMAMYDSKQNPGLEKANVVEQYGQAIYINAVVASASPIQEM